MKAEADVIAFPIKTKLMCSACGSPGEGSCRCGAPYVTPGVRAEAAVKANPEKSDRAIAEEIGVDQKTVQRTRKKLGEAHASPEKRKGKDGKSYTAKRKAKPRGTGKTAQKYQQTRTAVRESITTGQALDAKQVAARQGVSVDTVERAALAEQARVDLLEELNIDPKTLALSAQAKLDVAKRAIERKLNAEHAARMMQIDEEVRQRVLAEGKEYLEMLRGMEKKARETVALYTEWTNNLKPIFTVAEFNIVLKCLDSSAISFRLKAPDSELIKRFDVAMAIVRDKRDRLLLVKSK